MYIITDICINKDTGKSKAKAFVTIVFNNTLCIDGIEIFENMHGPVIIWPKTAIEKSFVEFYTSNYDFRNHIFKQIINQFRLSTPKFKKVWVNYE